MSYELLLARRRILMASSRVWPTLLYISEAEVSMCCKDGTDGKGGVFQLHPFFDDWLDHKSQCTWTTSDASRATVNGSGLVSFSAATSYGDVTISCAYRGVVKTCLLTVYETMPSAEVDGAGLWLCKGGKGLGQSGSRQITSSFGHNNVFSIDMLSVSAVGKFVSPSNNSEIYRIQKNGTVTTSRIFRYFPSDVFASNSPVVVVKKYNESSGRRSRGNLTRIAGQLYTYNDFAVYPNMWYSYGSSVGEKSNVTTNEGSVSDSSCALFFERCCVKMVRLFVGSSVSVSVENRANRTMFEYAYVPQNYVRYTDRDNWVNYTTIQNIGTLGVDGNLSCNNVPDIWFGV